MYAFSTSVELMKRLSAFVVNLTINLEPVYGIVLAQALFALHVPGFGSEKMSGGFYAGTVAHPGQRARAPFAQPLEPAPRPRRRFGGVTTFPTASLLPAPRGSRTCHARRPPAAPRPSR
ncbi:MAG: hypothetical protein WKG07_07750 [Hymenobacter sp.]